TAHLPQPFGAVGSGLLPQSLPEQKESPLRHALAVLTGTVLINQINADISGGTDDQQGHQDATVDAHKNAVQEASPVNPGKWRQQPRPRRRRRSRRGGEAGTVSSTGTHFLDEQVALGTHGLDALGIFRVVADFRADPGNA